MTGLLGHAMGFADIEIARECKTCTQWLLLTPTNTTGI
jgi:hypothetical protein